MRKGKPADPHVIVFLLLDGPLFQAHQIQIFLRRERQPFRTKERPNSCRLLYTDIKFTGPQLSNSRSITIGTLIQQGKPWKQLYEEGGSDEVFFT